MAPKQKLFADTGAVEKRGDEFRAHAQYRSQDGQNKHICGPNRSNEACAQKDLARMRAAAALGKDRAQGFEIMAMDHVFYLCFLNTVTRVGW